MRSAWQRPPIQQTETCLHLQPRPAAFVSPAKLIDRVFLLHAHPFISSGRCPRPAVGLCQRGRRCRVWICKSAGKVVLLMVLVPSFTRSELVPGIPGLCRYFRIWGASLSHPLFGAPAQLALPTPMLGRDPTLRQHRRPRCGGGKCSGPMRRG